MTNSYTWVENLLGPLAKLLGDPDYDYGVTRYRGPGIPISGEDYPRPDARAGWVQINDVQKAGDQIIWRRQKVDGPDPIPAPEPPKQFWRVEFSFHNKPGGSNTFWESKEEADTDAAKAKAHGYDFARVSGPHTSCRIDPADRMADIQQRFGGYHIGNL